MNSFSYLFWRTMVNRTKKALKKPVTYIAAVGVIFYVWSMIIGFGTIIMGMQINDLPGNLAIIISILIFLMLPSNFISYARRRGLVFKQGQVHFMFPAPVHPKVVILYTGIMKLAINVLMTVFIAFMGIVYFQISPLQMVSYAVLYLLFENVLEASMMILCYGNERLPERFFKVLTVCCYALMAIFVIVAFLLMIHRGFSFEVVGDYLSLPIIQMVPVIGWNIAMVRLIFIGPTVLNVICTLLFCITTLVLFFLSCRATCVGEYYEDAAAFADDYEKLREDQKKGVLHMSFRKKKKFKSAEVTYRGSYAKAIFYRQLLEYKKSRFFIFGFNTLVSLIVGIGIAISAGYDLASNSESMRIFRIPVVMSYVIFIFSGYTTKWSQELGNPYTFLIPDNSLKKLWYSTKIEHIRALIDGILMVLPGAIVLRLTPFQMVLNILLYVCLMANKLYYFMLADMLVGHILGSLGRTIVKLFFQGIAITIGVIAALIVGFLFGIDAGFTVMVFVSFLFTLFGAFLASFSFGKMEVME